MCKILLDDKSFCLKIDFSFYSNVLIRGSLTDGGWLATTSSLVWGAVWFLVIGYFKHFCLNVFVAVFQGLPVSFEFRDQRVGFAFYMNLLFRILVPFVFRRSG